jgi:hypothetical protein
VHRTGRIVVVTAIILYFSVSAALAGSRAGAAERRPISLVTVIKTPVKVLALVVAKEHELERYVSSTVLHAGVDLFTESVRWLSRKAEEAQEKSTPAWQILHW